jgi:hypothetical protein
MPNIPEYCDNGVQIGTGVNAKCYTCLAECPYGVQDEHRKWGAGARGLRINAPQIGNDGGHNESDPSGIDQHSPGAKLDAGKPMAGLLGDFGLALMEVAKLGTFGAEKYSRSGWESVENGQERYKDACWRHILKRNREDIDPDSGLDHLAAVAWNALAELELKLREKANG